MAAAVNILAIITHRFDIEANFYEIVEALGSVRDLAATIAQQFVRVCSRPDRAAAESICSCLAFLGGNSKPVERLGDALRSLGFIATLITTISILHENAASEAVELCIAYLICTLNHFPGFPYVAQALESGLLRVLLKVGASTRVEDEDPNDNGRVSLKIIELLTLILPRATVHYTVLLQLKKTFPEAVDLALKLNFHKSAFSREWTKFSTLVKLRFKVVDHWEMQRRLSLKACDNLDCGKIDRRNTFKVCAACRDAAYCSEHCQAADWRAGHKDVCHRLRSDRIQHPDMLTTRGKSFLRALLTDDYLRHMKSICLHQRTCSSTRANHSPPYSDTSTRILMR
ncbi:hypothetical protein B0H19DRAFT_379486 [Mycena capillaripes]|nr:hypothetical protein B0H19DRAFT_379486 [Mycena capillaripes]